MMLSLTLDDPHTKISDFVSKVRPAPRFQPRKALQTRCTHSKRSTQHPEWFLVRIQPSFTNKTQMTTENILLESNVVFSVNEGCIVDKDYVGCFVDSSECVEHSSECVERVCSASFG